MMQVAEMYISATNFYYTIFWDTEKNPFVSFNDQVTKNTMAIKFKKNSNLLQQLLEILP